MKITLRFQTSTTTVNHTLSLDETIVCGRSSRADVTINDNRVSSKHCQFTLRHNRLEIQDLNTKNGTFLNGISIEHSELFFGDEIRIGKVVLRLNERDGDEDAQINLTFPGPFKDRVSNELKMDFTGARIQNQQLTSGYPEGSARMEKSQLIEIASRKKILSKIYLSKEQIRAKYKLAAFTATCFDIAFSFLLLMIPVILVSDAAPPELKKSSRFLLLLGLEILMISSYYLANFKLSKFTLGEKLFGIRKSYMEQ